MSSRERILEAAVALVHEQGLDRVSMSAVGARSNVSRGTLYTNFESPDSILAEKWLESGEAWLAATTLLANPEIDPVLNDAFVDVVFCAPRRLELLEVLRPTFQQAFDASKSHGPAGQVVWSWQAATGLGALLMQSANMAVDIPLHQFFLAVVAAASSETLPIDDVHDDVDDAMDVVSNLRGSDVRSQLIRAATVVVANTGVANASTLRICRLARLTPGSFPNHFSSLEVLIEESFRVVFETVIDQNRSEYIESITSPNRARSTAKAITNAMRPERELWRKLRREMLVAARANSDVRRQVESVLNDTDTTLADSLTQSGYSSDTVSQFLALNRSLTLGMAMLFELGLPVANVNHFGLAKWLEVNFMHLGQSS